MDNEDSIQIHKGYKLSCITVLTIRLLTELGRNFLYGPVILLRDLLNGPLKNLTLNHYWRLNARPGRSWKVLCYSSLEHQFYHLNASKKPR